MTQWLWSVNKADKAHSILLDKYLSHHDVDAILVWLQQSDDTPKKTKLLDSFYT